MSSLKPLLIVAGRDGDDRPHAAHFTKSEETQATRAAALMGYQIALAQSGKALSAARALPKGKLFATGRALVPYAKQEVMDLLNTLVEFQTPAPAEELAPPEARSPDGSLTIGDVVLAFENKELGWWEAVVLDVDAKKAALSLRWRDFPESKKFQRRLSEVGIIGIARLEPEAVA